MDNKGFKIKVIPPSGRPFVRKSWQVRGQGSSSQKQITISLDFSFSDTPAPNEGIVSLHNIHNSDIQKFEKDKKIEIKAGWLPQGQNDQLVLEGVIKKVEPYDLEKRHTWAIDVLFYDVKNELFTTQVSKDWGPGTSATTVFQYLVQNELGAQFEVFNPAKSYTYPRGKTIYKPLRIALRNVARDLESKYFIYNRKVYLLPPDTPNGSAGTLSTERGNLINRQPAKEDGQYKVTSLFNTRIKPTSKVKVSSNDVDKSLRIKHGRHYTPNRGKKFRTELVGE